MLRSKTVVIPKDAMEKKAAINWAGNFGKMVSRLALNPLSIGEIYTVGTHETFTWQEVAEMYKKLGGLKYITVDTDDYLRLLSPELNVLVRQQLTHDRYFDRAIDNSKILKHSGLKSTDPTPIEIALKRELSALPKNAQWPDQGINSRMDAYLKEIGVE